MIPFDYPDRPHIRKHGPRGYTDISSFRHWLRDEFSFRCAYCLNRERWQPHQSFVIEHFLPVAYYPEKELVYDNLLYACVSCNSAKGSKLVPDPTQVLLAGDVLVHADGSIEGRSEKASELIESMQLDNWDYREFRRMWIVICGKMSKLGPSTRREVLGFPLHLPDLSKLRPPDGNSRSAGLETSAYTQHQRGELPATY